MSASIISIDNNNKCGYLDIIIGPMFSGKTTYLLRELNIFAQMGASVLYINSHLDTRGKEFSTHNPLITKIGNIDSKKVKNLEEIYELCKNYLIIGIDEAQFFPNLKTFTLELVEKYGKRVIISGLSGNYKREMFGEVIDLIPYCDNIVKLCSFCKCCGENKLIKNAHFSYRLSEEELLVLVGDKNEYIPLCRECYLAKCV